MGRPLGPHQNAALRDPSRQALFVQFPACAPAAVTEISGRVVAVTDGDTLKILKPDNELVKVRLAEFDAPEKKQPYGKRLKNRLLHAPRSPSWAINGPLTALAQRRL